MKYQPETRQNWYDGVLCFFFLCVCVPFLSLKKKERREQGGIQILHAKPVRVQKPRGDGKLDRGVQRPRCHHFLYISSYDLPGSRLFVLVMG